MSKKRKCQRLGRRIISLLLAFVLLCQMTGLEPYAEPEGKASVLVTRLEWMKMLMELFEFTVEEDNYPDNYYADIDKSSPDYYDVMLATEFGLIDVKAGEELRPGDAATREFAVHTLNLCLGYVLESETYTFSEAGSVTYPDDIQIAINQGWIKMNDSQFNPNQAITQAEKEIMTEAAKAVLESDESFLETGSYAYKNSVVVLPEDTDISTEDEDTFLIRNCPVTIREGDIFGKVCEGVPLAWRASKVEQNGADVRVTTNVVNTREAFDEISISQTNSVDLATLQPAAEGVRLRYVVGGTLEAHYKDGEVFNTPLEAQGQEITAVIVEQTIDAPTPLTVQASDEPVPYMEFPVGDAKVKIEAVVTNLNYKMDFGWGKVGVDVSFLLDFNCNVSSDFLQMAGISPTYELFYAPILPGLYVKGTVDLSFQGSVDIRILENVKLGFHYENHAPRLVSEFNKKSFTVTAQATMRPGVRLEAGFNLVGLSGQVYGKTGANLTAVSKHYIDEKKPSACQTISTYLYAKAGYNVMVDVVIYSGKLVGADKDIWTKYNSPVKTAVHYEDGKQVHTCTRGTSGMGYAGWGYFSPIDSQYYYAGGNSGGIYANGEVYTIFDYALDKKNQATITGYRGNAVNVFIPETLDGYPVIGIGERAFEDNKRIRSVTVPDCVKTIGGSAFRGCTALERVTLPENEEFTVINHYAFYECESLRNVEIPDNVTEIGGYAFSGCLNLKEVKLPKQLEYMNSNCFGNCDNLTSIIIPKSLKVCYTSYNTYYRGGPFNGCDGLKNVAFEEGITEIASNLFDSCPGIESIVIPDTVTKIESGAFYDCNNLKEVTLSRYLAEIESNAFCGCSELGKIDIPDNVTKIGGYAFSGCLNLTEVKLPKQLEYMNSNCFGNCDNLTSIVIPKSLKACYTHYNTYYRGGPFNGCDGLKNVAFEEGITEIASNLFDSCPGIERIIIPDTITKIESGAFYDCNNLKEVTLSKFLTEIENDAFCRCLQLEKIAVPDNVIAMGKYAFSGCLNLSEVTLSKKLEYMDANCFGNCDKLTNIVIPKSLKNCYEYDGSHYVGGPFSKCDGLKEVVFEEGTKEVADYLFDDCPGIENIVLPDTITEIGHGTFKSCINLKSITFSRNLTTIGGMAFKGCKQLEKAELPDSVTSIRDDIFNGCSSLKKVHIPNQLQVITAGMFFNCTSLSDINLPDTLIKIEEDAFRNCDSLIELIFPSQLEVIEINAFYDCDALTTVTISDTVHTIGSYVFEHCDSLSSVTLGASLASISNGTFMDCAALQELVIPYRVATIGSNAFKNDTKLTAVTIPKSVTSIDSTAFSYLDKLTISGVKDSYAQTFANTKGIAFNPIEVDADTVTLNKQESNIYPYDTEDLLAVVKPLDYTGDIVFSSSDSEVVSVTKTGRIRAEKTGTATITVQAGDKTATCRVNVLVPVSRIDVDNLTDNGNMVAVNTTHQLKWTISPENAANKKVTFSSSDEEIATVNKDGKISCNKAGNAHIYIYSEDGKASRTVYITVVEDGSASSSPQESKKPDNPQESKKPVPSPQTSEKPKIKGDVDGNGVIELKDAQITLRAALNLIKLNKEEKKAADVDGDDRITLKDAQKILKAALHLIHL